MEKFSTRLRRILIAESLWDQMHPQGLAPLEVPVWRNYNTLGTRRYINSMLEVMESNLPATWSITTDPEEIAKVRKKWWGNSHPVKMRGIDGRRARKGSKTLFIGRLGGEEVVVKVSGFPL